MKQMYAVAAGLMLVSGISKAQDGLRYGEGSILEAITPFRSRAVGIFAEQPLGKRFAVSSGLRYIWYGKRVTSSDSHDEYRHPGLPTAWEGQTRLLEVPVDLAFSLLGRNSSHCQTRIVAGLSYVSVVSAVETYSYRDETQSEFNQKRTPGYEDIVAFKIGLEQAVRVRQTTFALGVQLREANHFSNSTLQDFGKIAVYLKAGWQFRKSRASGGLGRPSAENDNK